MQKIITISLSEGEDTLQALETVAGLVKQGYTSGYDPNWSIDEDEGGQ